MADIPPEIISGYNEIVNFMSKGIEGTGLTWGHFLLIMAAIIFIYWYFEMRRR